MGNVRPFEEHTPVRGIPLDGGASESRAMDIEPVRGPARVPMWLLVLALLGGGGAGGSVAAVFGFDNVGSREMAEVRMEQAAHKSRLDKHDEALEMATDRQTSTQRWLADVLVRQSAAIGGIAEKVGAKVDVQVPQLIVEGR